MKPWREVTHIDNREKEWFLTLACGHLAVRRKRIPKRPFAMVYEPPRFAPERVRCVICPEEDPRCL